MEIEKGNEKKSLSLDEDMQMTGRAFIGSKVDYIKGYAKYSIHGIVMC